MHFLPLLLATILTIALSQTIQDEIAKYPSCSISCLQAAIAASGCATTDYDCQCGPNRDAITTAAYPCVMAKCSPDDGQATLKVAQAVCSLPQSSATSSGSSVSSSVVSSASSAVSSAISSVVSSVSSAVSAEISSQTQSASSVASSVLSSLSSEISSQIYAANSSATSVVSSVSSALASTTKTMTPTTVSASATATNIADHLRAPSLLLAILVQLAI